jgi:hypothetical protein
MISVSVVRRVTSAETASNTICTIKRYLLNQNIYPARFHRWMKPLFGPVSSLEVNISLKLLPWILGRGLRTPSKARRLVRGNTCVPVLCSLNEGKEHVASFAMMRTQKSSRFLLETTTTANYQHFRVFCATARIAFSDSLHHHSHDPGGSFFRVFRPPARTTTYVASCNGPYQVSTVIYECYCTVFRSSNDCSAGRNHGSCDEPP